MNRNLPAYLAAVLALAISLVLVFGTFSAPTFSLAEQKCVYLTFDDGPSDKVTPKILDVLKDEDVKATFFIIGQQAAIREKLVRRIADEGHKLGVHTYSHNYRQIYSSPQNLINDIDKCNEVIKSITGSYSSIYRFPGGSFNLSDRLKDAVKERGLTYYDWNASVMDADISNAKPSALLQAAISTSANLNKVVLLAHDSTGKTSTAEALRMIIGYFKSNGYVFKTL